MTFSFLSPEVKTDCLELEFEKCSNFEIVEITCVEDLTIHETPDKLKEFFMIHYN